MTTDLIGRHNIVLRRYTQTFIKINFTHIFVCFTFCLWHYLSFVNNQPNNTWWHVTDISSDELHTLNHYVIRLSTEITYRNLQTQSIVSRFVLYICIKGQFIKKNKTSNIRCRVVFLLLNGTICDLPKKKEKKKKSVHQKNEILAVELFSFFWMKPYGTCQKKKKICSYASWTWLLMKKESTDGLSSSCRNYFNSPV